MPFVEVKSIQGVFSKEEKARIIEETTSIYARMKGDDFAAGTWVVVTEVENGGWGEGGAVLLKENVPDDPESH